MNFLVTGGAGFLGSHLCKKLLSLNHKVYCIDNLLTGIEKNIYELKSNKNFKFINSDVINYSFNNNLEIDGIYNLACPASPIQYQIDPIRTIKTIIFGAFNILEFARKKNIKVLQASTSEIYGDPKIQPQNETYWGHVNPIGIRSCYDEGKRAAETIFFDYHRQYNLKIKVVRIFNTFGPNMNQNDGRVVSNFISQAINNEPITIYGDGSQTRSFCYVSDMIDGLIAMMETRNNITGPINLGNTEERTMLELASKIIKLTNSKSELIYQPLPLDDPNQRRPDISLANKILNWEPSVNLEQGLLKTIDYFKRIIEK